AFRDLLEKFSSVATLAAHIDSVLPLESVKSQRPDVTLPSAAIPKNGAVRVVPLTSGQRELWYASQMSEAASCAYNESRLLHFRGDLDPIALRVAIQRLSDRHEALRSKIGTDAETSIISQSTTVEMPVIDLSRVIEQTRKARLEDAQFDEAKRPFNLTEGPLF